MALHLLIDGYNLIRRSPILRAEERQGLELGRRALLERLRQYKRLRPHRITIVFDAAARSSPGEKHTQEKGIRLIYSARGESADEVIRRICRTQGSKLTVVTSDRELAGYAEKYGALSMASEEFEAKLEMAFFLEAKDIQEDADQEQNHYRRGSRKRGPARRLPKKLRKRRQRMAKL